MGGGKEKHSREGVEIAGEGGGAKGTRTSEKVDRKSVRKSRGNTGAIKNKERTGGASNSDHGRTRGKKTNEGTEKKK